MRNALERLQARLDGFPVWRYFSSGAVAAIPILVLLFVWPSTLGGLQNPKAVLGKPLLGCLLGGGLGAVVLELLGRVLKNERSRWWQWVYAPAIMTVVGGVVVLACHILSSAQIDVSREWIAIGCFGGVTTTATILQLPVSWALQAEHLDRRRIVWVAANSSVMGLVAYAAIFYVPGDSWRKRSTP